MKFRDEYAFLSNMYTCKINMQIEGRDYTFNCAESAFQAHKCPARASEFANLSGKDAKKAGRHVPLRRDWEYIKDDVMTEVVKTKFKDPDLMKKLMSVKGEICEDNTWHDTYWGKCGGVGQNKLGQILMSVRDSTPDISVQNQNKSPKENTDTFDYNKF